MSPPCGSVVEPDLAASCGVAERKGKQMMISLSSVLVDVDALAEDQSALTQARDLAVRCGARLKVVDVLPWVPSSARHFVTADFEQELVEHRTGRLKSVAAQVNGVDVTTELLRGRPATALIREVLAAGHDRLSGVSVQVVEGEPERVISHVVDRNGVDLVVMGTVAKSGIPGLLMGNTAERVLQRLRGSVFAVKPPGFVSPVGRT